MKLKPFLLSCSLFLRYPIFLSTALGALLGFWFGHYQVALSIAHMKTRWGWVCGTGLDVQLALWSVVGIVMGILVGILIVWLRKRQPESR